MLPLMPLVLYAQGYIEHVDVSNPLTTTLVSAKIKLQPKTGISGGTILRAVAKGNFVKGFDTCWSCKNHERMSLGF